VARGHDEGTLRAAIRFVRAAVPDPEPPLGARVPPSQGEWIRKCDERLTSLAAHLNLGYSNVLGVIPLEPVLQWQEQLITDEDVLGSQVANRQTLQALEELAARLTDDEHWGDPL
jgi:hypothetical protein